METRAFSLEEDAYGTLPLAINSNAEAPLEEMTAKFHSLREILCV